MRHVRGPQCLCLVFALPDVPDEVFELGVSLGAGCGGSCSSVAGGLVVGVGIGFLSLGRPSGHSQVPGRLDIGVVLCDRAINEWVNVRRHLPSKIGAGITRYCTSRRCSVS